jgi:hypothetical protein
VLGQWGPGGPCEGQLDAAKASALQALPAAVQDKGELRKASAKVRGEGGEGRDTLLLASAPYA